MVVYVNVLYVTNPFLQVSSHFQRTGTIHARRRRAGEKLAPVFENLPPKNIEMKNGD